MNKDSVTALMIACRKGNVEAINVLLNAGADPDIADAKGATWIHQAVVGSCSKETLQTIIQHGADVNATNENSITALVMACVRGKVEAINVLLDAGADRNITDDKGATWIHHAVDGTCSKETLQTIIDHGAAINARNKDHGTALMIACRKGNEEAIDVLLDAGADRNIADNKGATWIHHAVDGTCSNETLQTIINHGAAVNARNNDHGTALMIACRKGNIEAINVLLNAGADPNIADGEYCTCIHLAVYKGYNKDVLEAMIEHDADVNAANKDSITSLMIACQKGNIEAINVLLNAGADPNISDGKYGSCIQHAVIGGSSKEVLETIIDHGADVNAKNKHNITALMQACKRGDVEIINILLSAGADSSIADTNGATSIHYAVVGGGSKGTLQAIIDHGADVNASNKDNVTALMMACWMGNVEAINVLLNTGADLNIADGKLGITCIQLAVCKSCSKDVLEALIDHGADVNATNKDNVTALMIACQNGNMEAISILLNAGADPNISDGTCSTCIHHAIIGRQQQRGARNNNWPWC